MVPLDQVVKVIAKHEVFRPTAYYDVRGDLKIGYGTNLDGIAAALHCTGAGINYHAVREGHAITQVQGLLLLHKVARHAMDCVCIRVKGVTEMPENVQLAVIDMMYDLGLPAFGELYHPIKALEAGDLPGAVSGLSKSAWYHQRGQRALDDVALVESAIPVTA